MRRQWLEWWMERKPDVDLDMMIEGWNQAFAQEFPGSDLRWGRIYGQRWEYISGSSPEITYRSIRLVINDDLGLCLCNTEEIEPDQLLAIHDSIRCSMEGITVK